ncbi:MAG: monovalent cation/H+ antiporter complex subunit F, partial [Pseudomonadota bacterium]
MTSAETMFDLALILSLIVLAIGQVLSMVRLAIGPTAGDRVLALDTMVINALGLVIALGIFQGVSV